MANGSSEGATSGTQHQQSDSRPSPTINNEDFNVLIDILGTSDAEGEESVLFHSRPEISHAVEDLIGLDMSVNHDMGHSEAVSEPPTWRGTAAHGQTSSQQSHVVADTGSQEVAAITTPSISRQRHHKAGRRRWTHNQPGYNSGPHHRPVVPSLQFNPTSATVTPSSPQLAGAEASSVPISPLQLAPTSPFVTSSPLSQHAQGTASKFNGQKNESNLDTTQSPHSLSYTAYAASEYNQNSRADLMNLFATSQAPITKFSQTVSEVKQQVATLRDRIQKLDHDAREFAGEDAYYAVRKRSHAAEGTGQSLSQLDRTKANRHPAHASGSEKHAMKRNSLQHSRIDPDTDLHSIDLKCLSGEDAKRLLSTLLSGLLTVERDQPSPPFEPPRSIADIQRALQLTSDLDELVWRRAKRAAQSRAHASEPPSTYSAENVDALLERTKLWERAARGRKHGH